MHFEITGPSQGPVVVLAHSLGTDHRLWTPQVEALGRKFRLLSFDFPGHGNSLECLVPATIDELGTALLDLLDRAEIQRARFVGLSLGGLLGQWLGVHAADRIEQLVLASTASHIADPSLLQRRLRRIREERPETLSSLVDDILGKWLTARYLETHPEEANAVREQLLSISPSAYANTAELVCRTDLRSALAEIRAETLVITGRHDEATPPEWGHALSKAIPNASHVELDAAHLSNLEAAEAFSRALLDFLE